MLPDLPLGLLAPLPLAVTALLLAFRRDVPGPVSALPQSAALAALVLALAGLVQVVLSGPVALALTQGAFAPILREDLVSAPMVLLVAFIGWIVLRFSRSLLEGEARAGRFHALMLGVLAGVMVLMQAGSLTLLVPAFVAVGLGLRQLLLFYPGRAAARRAAAKASLVWHGGDVALMLATLILLPVLGTADLALLGPLPDGAGTGATVAVGIAIGLIVLAAVMKTAAFPLHGWLTEVMEAPTPVSALLHAGIINAGGVLLIKLSPLVGSSPSALAALAMIGGLTALFGAVVMLTQSAVKTALAWSTVAQMGFMLLQCGLGLWPLALLHILAHSMYKAHAFLSSGSGVAVVAAAQRPGPVAVPDGRAVLKAFGLAIAVYAAMTALFFALGGHKPAQALALGALLIFGVAYLVAQGLAGAAPAALTRRTILASTFAAAAYFIFQAAAEAIWGGVLPAAPVAGPLEWVLISLAIASFGFVAVAQALLPVWSRHPAAQGLRVHLANGLYLNAVLDRLIGGFRTGKTS